MNAQAPESRVSILNAVTSPLSFLVLAILIAESVLTAYLVHLNGDTGVVLWAILASMAFLIAIVVALAILRPEALFGMRPLSGHYAILFCDKLVLALEGPFSSLGGVTEDQAWMTLAEVTVADDGSRMDKPYVDFCASVSVRLRTRAEMKGRYKNAKGKARELPPAEG